MIIALCGPAASGKGTLAKMLAERLGLPHYDFGLIFRAIAFLSSRRNLNYVEHLIARRYLRFQDGRVFLRWIDLTNRLVSEKVGLTTARMASQNPERVSRLACTMVQHSSFVCDGRTCGSEIYPNANLVFYINASKSERITRRAKDSEEAGHFSEREVLDAERLLITPGAVIVETTGKTKEESLEELMGHLATRGLAL